MERLTTRRFTRLVYTMALGLLAIAAPVAAQNVKYFSLAAPATATTATTTIVLDYTNVANGNSTFNSVAVEWTTTGSVSLAVSGATAAPGGPGNFHVLAANKIALTDLAPTKRGDTLRVTLAVTIAGGSCSAGSIQWKGSAWTGSVSSPSTQFQQQNANPVTTIAAKCEYSVAIAPASLARGTTANLIATVSNAAASTANVTAITLTPPADITTAATSYSGLNIAPGTSAQIAIAASAPCQLADATNEQWTTAVSGFTRVGTAPTTSVTGSCSLAFTALPTSVATGVASTQDIVVKFLDGAGMPLAGFGGTVFLVVPTAGSTCTLPAGTQITAVNGVATFAGLVFGGTPGACSLRAYTTVDGKLFEVFTTNPFTVYAQGLLDCDATSDPLLIDWTNPPNPLPAWVFDGSPGVDLITDVSYYKGARGANAIFGDPDKDKPCVLLNYTLVNNAFGMVPDTTTQPGRTVPVNAFALFYDEFAQPNATFRVEQTYRDEWTGPSGWIVKRTKVCLDNACTTQVPLKACLGTLLVPSSMPFFDPPQDTTKRMPACVNGESWQTIPVAQCQAPEAQPAGAACARVTNELIILGDPIIPRGI
ncbi:MAG: hypothetical protein KJ018_05630 [Burkholderiales bacterium]|nr:hypothetical protein [Burkholderiales bacterium]